MYSTCIMVAGWMTQNSTKALCALWLAYALKSADADVDSRFHEVSGFSRTAHAVPRYVAHARRMRRRNLRLWSLDPYHIYVPWKKKNCLQAISDKYFWNKTRDILRMWRESSSVLFPHSRYFMQLKDSLSYSQEPANDLYPEAD
jgi:hypothetical protein